MSEFLRPRLIGARFEGGVIPLEMLPDVSALGEMIVAVAKWRYLEDNPKRKRVPRGFAESASLGLTEVEGGSAIAVIELTSVPHGAPDALQLPGTPPVYEKYYEEARDHIIAAVSAAERGEVEAYVLPPECLRYFDSFGRKLREGDAIEFESGGGADAARLTRTSRHRLIRASQSAEITEEVLVDGSIPEMDQDRMTFELQSLEGRKIPALIDFQHRDIVLEVFNGYEANQKVRIRGIGKYDRQERLVRLESVQEITALDPLDVSVRLQELRQLKDGWIEGEGRALSSTGLDWLAEQFEQQYPVDLPLPHLYPTPEGGVRAEWSAGANAVVLETDLQNHSASWLWFDRDSDADHERELNLEDAEDWNWWVDQIREKLGTLDDS